MADARPRSHPRVSIEHDGTNYRFGLSSRSRLVVCHKVTWNNGKRYWREMDSVEWLALPAEVRARATEALGLGGRGDG